MAPTYVHFQYGGLTVVLIADNLWGPFVVQLYDCFEEKSIENHSFDQFFVFDNKEQKELLYFVLQRSVTAAPKSNYPLRIYIIKL